MLGISRKVVSPEDFGFLVIKSKNFVDPILPYSDLFWDDIENYISQVEVGITVAERAMRRTLGSYRLE